MWTDDQECLIDAIHEGSNCEIKFNGILIPCIFDSLVDERPVMGDGGGKQIVQSISLVVPMADADFEDYPQLAFKVGQVVSVIIREVTYKFRVNVKSLDEASYTLTCLSVDV